MKGGERGAMFHSMQKTKDNALFKSGLESALFKSDLKSALCFSVLHIFKIGYKKRRDRGGRRGIRGGEDIGWEGPEEERVKGEERGAMFHSMQKQNTMHFSNQIWKVHFSNRF